MFYGIMGFVAMIVIIILLLKAKTIPSLAFVIVPVVAALICGVNFLDVGKYAASGVAKTATTACLFVFSIIFFGIMTEAGLFDTIINWLMKRTGNSVVGIAVLTCIISMIGHLDGGGASTFLITVPAMLPIYKKIGMRKTTLLTICTTAMGVMNLVPWGGPTMRSASVLNMDSSLLWRTLIPMQVVGIICALAVAVVLGNIEKKRGAGLKQGESLAEVAITKENGSDNKNTEFARPKLFIVNLILTLIVILTLCFVSDLPSYFVFMVGVCIAMFINYPNKKIQSTIVKKYSEAAIMMATTLFTAGVMLGVLQESGMMTEMGNLLVSIIPDSLGNHIPIIIGLLSAPLALVFSTDAYFYGILPILIGVGNSFGVDPVSIAIAMIVGRNCADFISPTVPATFLGCGLAEVQIGDHIKHTWYWVFGTCAICMIFGVIFGIIPL